MTDKPYTDADLRAEAARQHKTLTEDPDFTGIGEQMMDETWRSLGEDDFDAAQRAIGDLLTNAADVSAWAITLGVAGLQPLTEIGVALTTGGYPLAVQIAVDPELTDDAQAELITALTEAINTTASRVLGCTTVATTE